MSFPVQDWWVSITSSKIVGFLLLGPGLGLGVGSSQYEGVLSLFFFKSYTLSQKKVAEK